MSSLKLAIPPQLPTGVTQRAFDTVLRLVKNGQQVFGTPSSSLTWGIGDEKIGDEVKAGIEGEKMTAGVLEDWIKSYPNVLLFNSVRWPGVEGDSDHMLLVGRQIVIIDSKRWKSKRKYSVMPNGSIKRGTVPFPEGNVKMLPAMKSWAKIFQKGIRIHGIVCVAQDEVFVPYDENWKRAPFKLVTIEQLPSFLDGFIKRQSERDKMLVDAGLAASLAIRLIKPRDRRSELINVKGIN